MVKRKDLGDFDKGQIVMARQLGQCLSRLSRRKATVAPFAAMIEKCQNTQGIAACYVWGCVATDRLERQSLPLFITESAYNGLLSIRPGPRSNGTKRSVLMSHVFVYIMWIAGCMCVVYLGKRWHYDPLQEESKLMEIV